MINFSVPRSEQRKFERELKKYYKKSRKEFEHRVGQATMAMHRMAQDKAPRDNGDLRKNIHPYITNEGMTGEVESKAEYSAAVENGTKPHTIEIRKKKVLANPETGQIFGKKVQHPGTIGQPFMLPAWNKARKDLIKGLRRVFR